MRIGTVKTRNTEKGRGFIAPEDGSPDVTQSTNNKPASPIDARELAKELKRYQQPCNTRALFEVAVTLIPYLALVCLMLFAVNAGYWIALLLVFPAGGFLVRLFMIQHDCGHQSLFSHTWANDWVGRVLGVFTLTPYDYWLHCHAMHHRGSGNLDHRGIGDIDTLTVDEFLARSTFRQIVYRIYRSPICLFLIGPAYMFVIQHRLPVRMMKRGLRPWLSTMGTNVGILLLAGAMIWGAGLNAFLLVQIPTTLLAASLGVWLFFVQHQFEETVWDQPPAWNRHEAALHGSSHYDLPPALRWLTGNIGIHHVHHLNSRIPFFRLFKVLSDYPALVDVNRITLRESLSTIYLTLWDQQERRLVSFREALGRT